MPDINLHPGTVVALQRQKMDELDVAKAIAAGELTSPQRYGNGWLFNLRITGTGRAYRQALKEHVWRDPSLYMNEHFRERCYGLPVILEHPEKMMLDTGEYRDRNIGTIVYPYLRREDDEVWGIARILDAPAAKYMAEHQLSTSPAVVFATPSRTNERETMSNGEHLLIEGDPDLLDHLAVCEAGVWDKGGAPTGVDLASEESKMTDEERKAAEEAERQDRARHDAAQGEKLDKLLVGLDSLSGRMDALEANHGRRDEGAETEERQAAELRELAAEEEAEAEAAEEAGRDDAEEDMLDDARKRHDAARRRFDDGHRRLADAHKRLDDDGRKRHDDARKRFDDAGKTLADRASRRDAARRNDARADARRHDGDEPPFPLEEAARNDGESDEAYSRRMDGIGKKADDSRLMKRDDESMAAHCDRVARLGRRDRARKDAEERATRAEEEAAAAKADAAAAKEQSSGLVERVRELETRLDGRPPEEEAQFATVQARADVIYMALGDAAPRPLSGETLIGYRSRLARGLQEHSRAWKEEDLSRLSRHSPSAFEAAETAVYADANTAAHQPLLLAGAGGALREIKRKGVGGIEISEWAGSPRSWMRSFMPPSERFVTRLGRAD